MDFTKSISNCLFFVHNNSAVFLRLCRPDVFSKVMSVFSQLLVTYTEFVVNIMYLITNLISIILCALPKLSLNI